MLMDLVILNIYCGPAFFLLCSKVSIFWFTVSGISLTIKIRCSDGMSKYHSLNVTVTNLGSRPKQRKAIFIHTDILGTPVAETNKDGKLQ